MTKRTGGHISDYHSNVDVWLEEKLDGKSIQNLRNLQQFARDFCCVLS
jgi:hypothetical protein